MRLGSGDALSGGGCRTRKAGGGYGRVSSGTAHVIRRAIFSPGIVLASNLSQSFGSSSHENES